MLFSVVSVCFWSPTMAESSVLPAAVALQLRLDWKPINRLCTAAFYQPQDQWKEQTQASGRMYSSEKMSFIFNRGLYVNWKAVFSTVANVWRQLVKAKCEKHTILSQSDTHVGFTSIVARFKVGFHGDGYFLVLKGIVWNF